MAAETPFVKKRAPTLYLIAGYKILKGTVWLLVAQGILALAGRDLQELFNRCLRRVHLDPENQFFSTIGNRLDTVTPANVKLVAAGTCFLGCVSMIVGTGMLFRARWAIWLAILQSAFFIPMVLVELVRRPSWELAVILAANVAIAWYLFQNRERLFRHHRP
jgi:uncharacterized membrane protein (DUF2068 family)